MVFQAVVQFFTAIQTEVTIFFIAICAHQLLFGKYGLATNSPKKAPSTASTGRGSPASPGAARLAQSVKQLLRAGAGREQLARRLREWLEASTQGDASAALAEMLQSVGKATNAPLLAAVRDAVQDCGSPSSQLSELILRSYLNFGMRAEFDEVLEEVKQAGLFRPSTAALALRAAVAAEDFEGALAQLPGVAPALEQEGKGVTPSGALQGALQQLAQLAVKQAVLPALLRGLLTGAPHLAPRALEEALEAAARRGGPVVAAAEEIGRAEGVELTTAARCTLLRAPGSGEHARRLFAEAAGAGPPAPEILAAAAEAAVACGDADLAGEVLRALPPKATPEVGVAALRLYTRGPLRSSGTDAGLLELWDKHLAGAGTEVLSDTQAARLIAEASFRCQRPDVLGRLLSPTPVGAGHVALLKAFATSQRLPEAHRVFEACPEKTTIMLNALLDACVDCRDMEAAESLMEQAVAENMADAVTYNTIIKKHLQRGDLKRARAAIETMRSAGGNSAPNCVTFNEFIDAALRTSTKAAWDLIEEMKAFGLQPTGVTCSILLKGVQRPSPASELERAMAMADELEEPADEVLVSSMCEACIRAGRADLLQRALRRMRGPGCLPVTGAHTFGSLVRAYGFLGDVAGAWAAWKEMRALGVVPTSTTVGCMVEAVASNGDPEAAHRLVQELGADAQTRPLLNATIYGSVIKGFSHRKQFGRVWTVYKEMLSGGTEMSIATFNGLLDACARSGDLCRIPGLLQDMARLKIEANLVTYSTVLKAHCQEGRLDRAFEVLEEMKTCKNLQPDEIVYNTLIDGCARNCLYERGVGVLREMQERGVTPSVYTISVLVKLASRCKKPQQAMELCNEVSRKHNIRLNVHAYNNLVFTWTQQGRMREAFETLERMLRDGVWPDTRTYTVMLRGCVSALDAQGAAGLLRAASGLRGVHPRISIFDAKKLQLRGGLPEELVTEVTDGIASKCGDNRLAQQLLWDIRSAKGARPGPRGREGGR